MRLKNLFNNSKPLGIAFGSGGSRGMAHLGVLKAFEEENIEFDIITGTSIGSVIGGLYAKGYSSSDIFNIALNASENRMEAFPLIKLRLLTVSNFFQSVFGELNFDDLKKPFACVAVDCKSGDEVVLSSGNLLKAMSASSAIPPIFSGVEIDGNLLFDGAFVNSVPCDLVKAMGAKKIIGVSLSYKCPVSNESKLILDKLYKNNNVKVTNDIEKQKNIADFMLEPDLSNHKSISLNGLEEMYEIGYLECKKHMKTIKKILK